MFGVSPPAEGKAPSGGATEENGAGVLSNLPRTRPQRATARRAAARETGGSGSANGTRKKATRASGAPSPAAKRPPKPAKPAAKRAKPARASAKPAVAAAKNGSAGPRASSSRARRSAPKRPAARPPEDVPRQGFETEDERAVGAVPPPGTTDLLSTAVEAIGEIAKAGIAGSERLVRDVFSRLGR